MKDLSALDADLKARLVTTEELMLAMSSRLGFDYQETNRPCSWWDRTCDVGLLIGSFIHGFGSYEAMRNDEDLPFRGKIKRLAFSNEVDATAQECFVAAASAARKVFDTALGSAKSKAQEEVHAVVAKVYAASKGEGGEGDVGAGSGSPTSDTPNVPLPNALDTDDTHLVTLTQLSKSMTDAARAKSVKLSELEADTDLVAIDIPSTAILSVKRESDNDSQASDDFELPLHKRLPMPDSRVLDSLLVRLIGYTEVDTVLTDAEAVNGSPGIRWEFGKDALEHEKARSMALQHFLGLSEQQVVEERRDFNGIGFNGTQCASTHRSLDDGSDYSLGAATQGLAQVATGTDAPRYLRTLGVPMNLTRYASSALVYTDGNILQMMLSDERERSSTNDGKADADDRTSMAPRTADDEAPASETDPEPSKAKARHQSLANPSATVKAESTKEETQQHSFALSNPLIVPVFRDSASVRAGLCVAALHCGFPTLIGADLCIDPAIMSSLLKQFPSSVLGSSDILFSIDNMSSKATSIVEVTMPPVDAIRHYFDSVLLPHCLRLCVMGNGPTTQEARGNDGKFETALGISTYPDCSKKRQSPLPDPCASLAEHSIEAVACAFAILRRTRLLRAAQHVVTGGVPLDRLMQILQSSAVRSSMDDLPVWWCPEIHDVGLMVHAATRGLFSVLADRKTNDNAGIFAYDMIRHHIQTRIVAEAASNDVFSSASPDEVTSWIEDQAQQFPSANTLERRLGLLCAVATAHLRDDSNRFDTLPMWDHGAWPRK